MERLFEKITTMILALLGLWLGSILIESILQRHNNAVLVPLPSTPASGVTDGDR